MAGCASSAGSGRVYKVLPQLLDQKGQSSQTPSLYDRDAYQAYLRKNPEKISGMRFAIQWKASGASDQLKLRVEMRGTAKGDLPKEKVLEQPVENSGWFSHWDMPKIDGADYKEFGEVTAWRVSLWDGSKLLSEQKSFLWQY
jgi:hypothetical protein